jgi:hypothetical protein
MATKAALYCAAALAAALTYPAAATAQNSAPAAAPQADPSPGQASPAPAQDRPAKAPAQPDAPAKAKPAKASDKADDDKEKDKRAAALATSLADTTSAQAECAWVGKRVVSLLVRDDVDTATDFTRFYAMFHCPEAHIGATLACVVSDPGAAREGAALTEHVDLCWVNPSTRLLPQKPPNPDKPAPAAK